jgi:hypothetical protein
MSADYMHPCQQLTSPTTSLQWVSAAIRRIVDEDKFPYAPRLDPLRVVVGKFEAAMADGVLPRTPVAVAGSFA